MLCDGCALPNFAYSQALASADVLLVAAGAGFSADSGLPVYDSIAADESYASMGIAYSDLCNPLMMVERPELFFGFWGECCNLYKAAPLHAGYSLLNRWAEEARQRLPANADLQPCWVYTSNVDGNAHRPLVSRDHAHRPLVSRDRPSISCDHAQVYFVVAARLLMSLLKYMAAAPNGSAAEHPATALPAPTTCLATYSSATCTSGSILRGARGTTW